MGHYTCFTKPFRLELLMKRDGVISYSEEEEDEEEEEEEEEEEILPPPISNFKTFKVEQCVICLGNIPNVLFCNCGHICICETCNVNEFTNCPMCKKESTILRIIE